MAIHPLPPQPVYPDIPPNPVVIKPIPPEGTYPVQYLGPPVPAPPRKRRKHHRKHRKLIQPSPPPVMFSEDIPRANPVGGFGGVAPISAPYGQAVFVGSPRIPVDRISAPNSNVLIQPVPPRSFPPPGTNPKIR